MFPTSAIVLTISLRLSSVSEILYPVILKQGCIKLLSCHTFYIVVVYGTFAESEMRGKLELLSKQALRLISDDNNNTYETLLNNLNMTTLQTRSRDTRHAYNGLQSTSCFNTCVYQIRTYFEI